MISKCLDTKYYLKLSIMDHHEHWDNSQRMRFPMFQSRITNTEGAGKKVSWRVVYL